MQIRIREDFFNADRCGSGSATLVFNSSNFIKAILSVYTKLNFMVPKIFTNYQYPYPSTVICFALYILVRIKTFEGCYRNLNLVEAAKIQFINAYSFAISLRIFKCKCLQMLLLKNRLPLLQAVKISGYCYCSPPAWS